MNQMKWNIFSTTLRKKLQISIKECELPKWWITIKQENCFGLSRRWKEETERTSRKNFNNKHKQQQQKPNKIHLINKFIIYLIQLTNDYKHLTY